MNGDLVSGLSVSVLAEIIVHTAVTCPTKTTAGSKQATTEQWQPAQMHVLMQLAVTLLHSNCPASQYHHHHSQTLPIHQRVRSLPGCFAFQCKVVLACGVHPTSYSLY